MRVVHCARISRNSTKMPSYQFNHFSGRLQESRHFQPLYPISTTRLESSEPPKMIYDSIKTKPVTVSNARASSSGGILPKKMLKTFEMYQKDLEYPVYKIRGTPDKILFGFSTVLLTVSMGMCFAFIYRQAFPPREE